VVKIGFEVPDAEEAIVGYTGNESGVSQTLVKHVKQVFRRACPP
jgi:hypothetical protein